MHRVEQVLVVESVYPVTRRTSVSIFKIRIGSPQQEESHHFCMSPCYGSMQWSIVIFSTRIDVRTMYKKNLCSINIAPYCDLVKRIVVKGAPI